MITTLDAAPLASSTPVSARRTPALAVYRVATGLFCLQMGFTAYAQLNLPVVAEMFTHLGFPDYFRLALSWAKIAGIVALVAPVAPRLKEWAHAGFAITLVFAVVAHLAVGDGPEVWSWALGTLVLWSVAYGAWRRVSA